MILIKNIEVYAPKSLGVKDVLIGGKEILQIDDNIDCNNAEIIDGKNKILTPGFIDNHVHVTGGGGEAGFFSKAPEVKCSNLIKGGITTVCGLLGTDGATRNIENLVSKLYGLRELGISAYGYTGSYRYPSNTLTGDIQKDIIFLDPIIGLKIALSDHRSSNISNHELARIAADTRVAGMIGKKRALLLCIWEMEKEL
ncbi:MAG: amidohydrolase family protein [Tissierellia bacterium]|nr:amidohydrolase family protein [Tissierellia bacterium]